jgi:hypothetical protein
MIDPPALIDEYCAEDEDAEDKDAFMIFKTVHKPANVECTSRSHCNKNELC